MRWYLVIAMMLCVFTTPAYAAETCVDVVKPDCVYEAWEASDREAIDKCAETVRAYQRMVKDHTLCKVKNVRDENKVILDEMKQISRDFSCRLGVKSMCRDK